MFFFKLKKKHSIMSSACELQIIMIASCYLGLQASNKMSLFKEAAKYLIILMMNVFNYVQLI